MKFNIIKYNCDQKNIWDDFVSNALNSNFLYFRKYLDYHSNIFIDHSLLAFHSNKLVAILPANENDYKLNSHEGLTYGGWLIAKGFKSMDFGELFANFEQYAKDNGFKEIIYKQKPSFFAKHFNETESWVMWNRGWELYRRDLSYAIDLQNFMGLSKDKRYRFNKCLKNDLRIDWLAESKDLFELIILNLDSKFGVKPTHNLDEMNLLQNRFPNNIKTMAVYKDSLFLGGIWLFQDSNFIHTQYWHTNDDGKDLGASEFLVHTLIEEYKLNKRWLSFGTSTLESGRELNSGLANFKESFGAAGFVHDFYVKII